jgi:hypothetical protein
MSKTTSSRQQTIYFQQKTAPFARGAGFSPYPNQLNLNLGQIARRLMASGQQLFALICPTTKKVSISRQKTHYQSYREML